MPDISVIICAHNPRPDYLRRVLESLRVQTLSRAQWELLLVDNASKQPLAGQWDLSWHEHSRHIREDALGLTPARLCGMQNARADLLVLVDDDNVLRPDFLANTLAIARDFPFLGAWGAHIEGEFEQEVPEWLKPYLHALAIREMDRDYWSNYHADNRSLPFGAGLCVRKSVAQSYAQAIVNRPASLNLGRKGTSLVSGEDVDLAMTAYDAGLGTGMFRRLQITHLIPKTRMTVDYVCRLLEAIKYSNYILRNQRDPAYVPSNGSLVRNWLNALKVWRLPEPVRSFAKAESRGFARARAEILAKP
jgi:glycosyltransferase involved in cell wall biosynthesis